MKRTTGFVILLAALGGCSSVRQGPEMGEKFAYDARGQAVPSPVAAKWRENDRLMNNYQYAGGTSVAMAGAQDVTRPAPGGAGAAMAGEVKAAQGTAQPAPAPAAMAGASQASYTPASLLNLPDAPKPAEAVAAKKPDALPAPKDAPAMPPPPPGIINVDQTPGLPEAPVPDAKAQSPATGGAIVSLDHQPGRPAATPAVRMVNSKRITINYEVKDVGPSGISGVELWYTQDGKSWKKRDVPSQTKPPYIIEVDGEGLYGFTLLARSGIGLSKDAPKPGDLPQIWVEVDLTKPAVQLTGINANCANHSPNVVIRWTATDKNLGARPITLSYATKEDGPWMPIASNVENTGRYVWQLPTDAPAKFLVRVEATDVVGNVGMAQTPKPVLFDRSQPNVAILSVEPTGK
jgi:hypothetical protein